MQCQWKDKIFNSAGPDFEKTALELFRFQYENNDVYKQYVDALHVDPLTINSILQIPFLPIRFFKSHAVKTGLFEPATVFESSGTTGSINSRHFVKDIELYKESFTKGFELFYGPITDWCIIGLLPSYLERENSSLVYMVNELIRLSGHVQSGFYLNEYERLVGVLTDLQKQKQKTLLIGVTFGLLDFAESFSSSIQPGLFDRTTYYGNGWYEGAPKRNDPAGSACDIAKNVSCAGYSLGVWNDRTFIAGLF